MTNSYDQEVFPAVPFVIVVDRSGSMQGNGGMDLINSSLPELVDALKDNPEIEETASVGLVSFANTATLHRNIEPLNRPFAVPTFKADGTTSYAAPLRKLRSMIETDLPKLGPRGHRPIVFFITDGKPNFDDRSVWREARDHLLESEFRLRPKLVALGCGEVQQSCLEELASAPNLARWKEGPTKEALQAILRTVRGTIITLTQEANESKEYVPDGPDDLVAEIFDFHDYDTGPNEVFEYHG